MYEFSEQQCQNLEFSTRREWLLTNGLGGFAMGSISGINTRRYHGHLVAAIGSSSDRIVLLASVDAFMQGEEQQIGISSNQYPGAVYPEGHYFLRKVTVGDDFVRWLYRSGALQIEKSLQVLPGKNAAVITYTNKGETQLLLTLRPLISDKPYHDNFSMHEGYPEQMAFPKDETVITDQGVSLVLAHPKAQRMPVQGWYYRFEHAREVERGLEPRDDLFCPCELKYELLPGEKALLIASTQKGMKADAEEPTCTKDRKLSNQLRAAARHFVVKSGDRPTIIAGYPWFTDWGRDTMIALPGICLHTDHPQEARAIIDGFASQMHQGLIPNRFVEGGEQPQYNTVDGTLWFVNAIYKTLDAEWDQKFAERCLAALKEVYSWHTKGTLYGIKVDPSDGLLTQGEPGLQLTWMDAKVGDWVITPRHGKPVEISGLWINAMRIGEWLARKLGADPKQFKDSADLAEANFDRKFWHEVRGHYLDTADPDDASLRPNQVISMSLPFPSATGDHAKRAFDMISKELLTPVGLRTLGPSEPGYKGRYTGPMPELDAAYHQGTVWPWLLGPYCSAWARLGGSAMDIKALLKNAKEMMAEYGIGGVAEVYDGDEPHNPNGCPWQAWSVAEMLRAWIEDARGEK